jgi:hypothetical protein
MHGSVGGRIDTGSVAGSRHEATALAAFQGGGERRLVYARLREQPTEPLYYLADGTAAEVREWARAHLECPMPDCGDRRLKTMSRSRKRDGFSHHAGAGGHAREGLFHVQAKALIARWVRDRWPEVRVQEEEATASGDRRADVMLTWSDGRQVAIELQYAPLTPQAWRVRHDAYRRQGIVDVWLLGHLPPYLRSSRAPSWECPEVIAGRITLGPLHQAICDAGLPLLWVSPIEEQVGTAWAHEFAKSHSEALGRSIEWGDGHDDTHFLVPPSGDWLESATFDADDLSTCELTSQGITTPTLRRLHEERQRLAAVNVARLRKDAARKVALAKERAEVARQQEERDAKKARRDADRQGFERWLAAKQAEQQARWESSDLHGKVIARYGKVPSILAEKTKSPGGVYAHPGHWHAVLYGDLILGQAPGSRFSVGDCYRRLREANITLSDDPQKRSRALVEWLDLLERRGHVRIDRGEMSSTIEYIEVVADIERYRALEAERAEARHQQRLAAAERHRQNQEHDRVMRAKWATRRERASGGQSAGGYPAPVPVQHPVHHCSVCGQALDASLAVVGRHILC